MHFGATLRLLRTNAGWTLRDLAERLGVSNAYLSRVENGHDRPPTPDRLAELAALLNLPGVKLIELADRITPAAPSYLAGVPAARELFLELVRRELTPADLARVRAFVEREFPIPGMRIEARSIFEMLSPERVVMKLACHDLSDAIDIAAVKLASGRISASTLADSIRARERECSTALGGGLCVPYTLAPELAPSAAVVTLRSPLLATTPDQLPLRLLLVHTHRGPPEHTRILAQLAQLLAEESVVASVCAARTPAEVVAALRDLLVGGATPVKASGASGRTPTSRR